ncbi:MAG: hypothetical protein RLZZ596_412 [Pseudomonadota bacterium]
MSQSPTSIVLAGGCFWCLEAVYLGVRGVMSVESGYCNGHVSKPSYEQVCTGGTGHAEVVKLTFDPQQISLRQLLDIIFTIHDPTTLNRQGNDVGSQYRSGIYYQSPEQAQLARAYIEALAASGVYRDPIVTEILPLENYWPAEDYHQNYFARNPHQGYCAYVVAPKVAKFEKHFAELSK